jgi:hypothetical protein
LLDQTYGIAGLGGGSGRGASPIRRGDNGDQDGAFVVWGSNVAWKQAKGNVRSQVNGRFGVERKSAKSGAGEVLVVEAVRGVVVVVCGKGGDRAVTSEFCYRTRVGRLASSISLLSGVGKAVDEMDEEERWATRLDNWPSNLKYHIQQPLSKVGGFRSRENMIQAFESGEFKLDELFCKGEKIKLADWHVEMCRWFSFSTTSTKNLTAGL